MYGRGTYAPKEYRAWLAARIKPLIRAHGLERGREDPLTGGVRSSALGMLRDDEGERQLVGSAVRQLTGSAAVGGERGTASAGAGAHDAEAPDAVALVSASLTGLGVQPTLF
jgi:hypothetical protein